MAQNQLADLSMAFAIEVLKLTMELKDIILL